MKWRAFAVALALGCAVCAARAADQSVARTQYESSYYPTNVNWTGFYVGLNLGGGVATSGWTDPVDGLADNPRSGVIIGGAQFGANWQFDALVVGFEADFDATDLRGNSIDAAGDTHLIRASWLSTVTGRVGYAFGQALLYAKGGFASGNERDTLITATGHHANTSNTTQIGWTVGGGVEYGITQHWSARLEYDFIDLAHGLNLTGNTISAPVTVDYTVQRVVAGVNYRF